MSPSLFKRIKRTVHKHLCQCERCSLKSFLLTSKSLAKSSALSSFPKYSVMYLRVFSVMNVEEDWSELNIAYNSSSVRCFFRRSLTLGSTLYSVKRDSPSANRLARFFSLPCTGQYLLIPLDSVGIDDLILINFRRYSCGWLINSYNKV